MSLLKPPFKNYETHNAGILPIIHVLASSPLPLIWPSTTVINPESLTSRSILQHDNVVPTYLVLPPSPSTTTTLIEKQGILIKPQSLSTSISYNDFEPTNLLPQTSPFQAIPTDVKTTNSNTIHVHEYTTNITIHPSSYNLQPSPTLSPNYDDFMNMCWTTIANAVDCLILIIPPFGLSLESLLEQLLKSPFLPLPVRPSPQYRTPLLQRQHPSHRQRV